MLLEHELSEIATEKISIAYRKKNNLINNHEKYNKPVYRKKKYQNLALTIQTCTKTFFTFLFSFLVAVYRSGNQVKTLFLLILVL
jgi:hypothetical protein